MVRITIAHEKGSRTRTMGNVAHLLNPRTREYATMVERHQPMGRIAHLTAFKKTCLSTLLTLNYRWVERMERSDPQGLPCESGTWLLRRPSPR